jgi:hypothetical protein
MRRLAPSVSRGIESRHTYGPPPLPLRPDFVRSTGAPARSLRPTFTHHSHRAAWLTRRCGIARAVVKRILFPSAQRTSR